MVADFFENKVAVITGGSRNIGLAVATALVERGAKVVIGDVLDTEGRAAVKGLNTKAGGTKVACYLHTDVTKYRDLIALFELAQDTFGGVDITFLNAGIATPHDMLLEDLDDEADERLVQINALGVVKGTKVAVRYLAKRNGGVIVNTASTVGLEATNYSSIYNASKHAVVGWSRSFTQLPRIANIRINAVCPHGVLTELLLNDFTSYHRKFLEATSLNTEISTVVKATLLLMEDERYNGATLKALPGDMIEVEEPPEIFSKVAAASFSTDKLASIVQALASETESEYKSDFDRAVKRYFEKKTPRL